MHRDYNKPTIATSELHTVGLKEDGTVVAVGWNWQGQLNVSGWTNIKAIAAGFGFTVGLREDGTVVATDGYDVSGWTNIKAIAAGSSRIIGLKKDGTVVGVGSNGDGQLNASDWTDIKAIAAGTSITVGLKEDGTVVAAGYYGGGNVSDWTNITAIAAGYAHIIGLKEDGTVVGVGSNWAGQLNISDWTNIRQPACLNSIQLPTSITSLPDFISVLPGISSQLLSSLMAKSENAIKVFDNGNKSAAVNILNAMLNEISAQTGKKLTTDAADILTVYRINENA